MTSSLVIGPPDASGKYGLAGLLTRISCPSTSRITGAPNASFAIP